MSDEKEVKLAGKMRAQARQDGLPADHPLYALAAALDSAAANAFAPGGGPPGAHRAYRAASDDARSLFRAYRQTRHRR